MRTRILVLVLFLAVFGQGCTVDKHEGATGFAYIAQAAKISDRASYNLMNYPEMLKKGKTPDTDGRVKGNEPVNKQPVSPQNKKAYLTFDDGPDSVVTQLILDTLDRYGVKGTFFVVGTEIEKNPEVLKDIVERGHAIGNHTYNHRYEDIYSRRGGFLESIKKNEELIFRITGQRPVIVREPGGAARNSTTLRQIMAENGYRMVYWNVESYDSRKPYLDSPEIIEKIRQQSGKKQLWPEMIIIMHDGQGHLNTARALPTVIEMLKRQGFRFDVLK